MYLASELSHPPRPTASRRRATLTCQRCHEKKVCDWAVDFHIWLSFLIIVSGKMRSPATTQEWREWTLLELPRGSNRVPVSYALTEPVIDNRVTKLHVPRYDRVRPSRRNLRRRKNSELENGGIVRSCDPNGVPSHDNEHFRPPLPVSTQWNLPTTNIANAQIGSHGSEMTRAGFTRLPLPDIPLDQPRGADASTSPRNNDPVTRGSDGRVGVTDARSVIVESSESEGVSSYLGDSGYITMFVRGNTSRSSESSVPSRLQEPATPLPIAVRDYHLQVFDEYCFTFCPILDKNILEDHAFSQSLLLEKALTLVSHRIQPSLLDGDNAAILYNQSKDLFYKSSEPSPTASLISIMLFYWWSTCSPSMLSTNGTWYWTGIAIRQAQEMGLHRLPRTDHYLSHGDTLALRRRIWWTLFVCHQCYGHWIIPC